MLCRERKRKRSQSTPVAQKAKPTGKKNCFEKPGTVEHKCRTAFLGRGSVSIRLQEIKSRVRDDIKVEIFWCAAKGKKNTPHPYKSSNSAGIVHRSLPTKPEESLTRLCRIKKRSSLSRNRCERRRHSCCQFQVTGGGTSGRITVIKKRYCRMSPVADPPL